jgi:ketosteroid isomerase-like protein
METTRTKVGAAEAIARAKDAYAAFNRGDFAKGGEVYADDVVWHFVSGDARGKAAVVAVAKDQMERFKAKAEPHDILANDEHVVSLLTYTVQGKPYKLIHIAHLNSEGKIVEGWSLGDPELAKVVTQR